MLPQWSPFYLENNLVKKTLEISFIETNELDIAEKKLYPKTKKIKNISRIHLVKYNYSEAKTKFHVWQCSGIGPGKKKMYLLDQKHQNLKKNWSFMMVERNLVLCLKRERILLHYRFSPIYRRGMCSHVLIICKIAVSSWFWTSILWVGVGGMRLNFSIHIA